MGGARQDKDLHTMSGDICCTKEGDKQKDIYLREETKTGAEQGKRRKIMAACEKNCGVFCAYRKKEKRSIWDEGRAQTMPYKNKAREDMLHIVCSDGTSPVFNYCFHKV